VEGRCLGGWAFRDGPSQVRLDLAVRPHARRISERNRSRYAILAWHGMLRLAVHHEPCRELFILWARTRRLPDNVRALQYEVNCWHTSNQGHNMFVHPFLLTTP
jgi:hypothetical protein